MDWLHKKPQAWVFQSWAGSPGVGAHSTAHNTRIHKREYYLAMKDSKRLHEWITKALCWVKKARHRRVYSVWFHLYETLEKANINYSIRKQSPSTNSKESVGRLTPKEHKENWGVMKMFILIGLLVECIHFSKLIKTVGLSYYMEIMLSSKDHI